MSFIQPHPPAQVETATLEQPKPQVDALILRCALPIPVNQLYDYLPPEGTTPISWLPGTRLELPFGKRRLIGYLVRVEAQQTPTPYTLKPAIRLIDEHPLWDRELFNTLNWASHYYHHPIGDTLSASLPQKLRQGVSTHEHRLGYRATIDGLSLVLGSIKGKPRQQAALEILRDHPKGLSNHSLRALGIKTNTLQALCKQQLIEPYHTQNSSPKTSRSAQPVLRQTPQTLNSEQQHAVDSITAHLQRFQCFLLDGITGSGKTEVYLHLIAALPADQQVLVLIPEITLTPQTLQRFTARFDLQVVPYHSGLSESDKLDYWIQTANGQASIIIGTRSAAFLRFNQLGLIIIDEEHDASLKQQEQFCYSARDLAIYRAKQLNIPVVLGSATPSLESLYNAQKGRFLPLTLHHRAGPSMPPKLRLVDIRNQPLTHGLCPATVQKIADTLQAKQQVLIFLNRRGYAPLLMCHKCGHDFLCPHCDAHCTVHKKKQLLKCHHCQYSEPLPQQCPKCQHDDLQFIGQGTERIEQDIQALFPNSPTVRIDRDNIQNHAALKQQLALVATGRPLILVGTQMISKGHHFPNVTFACIVDADAGLFSVDFRATERLAQLTTQVAGRAGRAEYPGEVWLQTRHPEHPTLSTLLDKGYAVLAKHLLEERAQAHLPPYTHLALIRSEAQQADLAQQFLNTASKQCQQIVANHSVQILGPVTAPMEKRAGHTRYQLLLQANHRSDLHKLLDSLLPVLENDQLSRKVRWRVDIDPLELY